MRAIVTGHTRGLGAAIAERLLARNILVLGLARSRNLELVRRYPDQFDQVELDLADPAALTAWIDGGTIARFFAGCRGALLVNNAGVVDPIGPLPMQDAAGVARAVALNVSAPLVLASALAATVPEPVDRRILHVSSGAGRNPYAGWSVYCATKAALDHHARAVAADATPSLRICSLAPGIIDTDMQAAIRATSPERFPMHARFVGMHRDGALASPADIAQQVVTYLLGERFGEQPVADLRELRG